MDPTAKTALSLSDKVMTLVGKVFGPSLTRRQADADTRAELQAVLTEQVATYMESHPNDPAVMDAIISCGGKFGFENIARIARLAIPRLNEEARPDLISDDWYANWRDKARTCSDPDMSELWASLLAGEANYPGSYSRKTVNVLADLEPDDARLFRNLSMFRIVPVEVEYNTTSYEVIRVVARGNPRLVVMDHQHPIYTGAGANYASLVRLEWLGLVPDQSRNYRDRGDGVWFGRLGY